MMNSSMKSADPHGPTSNTAALHRPLRPPLRIEQRPGRGRRVAASGLTQTANARRSQPVKLPADDPARDWTWGLKTRTANALRGYGYTSREAVAAVSERRLLAMTSFGRGSLADLRRWLGRAPSLAGD